MASEQEPMDMEGLIRFYAEAGVDSPLSDEPVDRFAEGARPKAAPQQPRAGGQEAAAPRQSFGTGNPSVSPSPAQTPRTAAPAPARTVVPDEAQVAIAREAASTANSLEELRERLAAFDGCNLKFTAKNMCFSDGDPASDLMFIGEAPGRDEDMEGLPFVGRSGQLLNRMIAAIGLERQNVYIANTIPWRPPGNRTPTPLETELCRPFIERQIELADPKVLVALGGPAAKALTGAPEGILRLRGNWKTHTTPSGKVIPVMPTLHPAYLLRSPAQKRFAWRDFLGVKMKLRELTSAG
ncbi:DNA polymerase [Paramesorhizobium deserti]|uniref:Type-4 uracil-DNA glycosylase n=1 Tax=Paramesorhizobium deserti TaxID=1494590 RepID=A0A135HYN4_9HYPH|nr:uracil-DNA glycosylase [Paramesorhizobium deserti]KXF78258.1 DNA polymerase [Paramesorhizobium deserti]